MTYCTQDDIEKQVPRDTLIELTDDYGANVVDTGMIARAIADADEEIDAFISMQYSLPFGSTPALVRLMSVNLAICNLYGRRPHLDIPETRKERCDRDRRRLELIAGGKLKIDVPDPDTDSDAGVGISVVKSDRVFTRGKDSDSSAGTLDNY